MAADDLMKIRITADFKEAEGAFLKMAKVATAFESDFKRIASSLNKDFNRINGMAELFGDTTNVVKDKMDALKRAMEQLMTRGLQAMNPEVQKLKAQYDALAASITHTTEETTKVSKTTKEAGNSVKKSNQQWTNWALVLQDLPYGFRGIQNNLPALMGGIAGMAGPLYLVGSAIIALFTAWDQGSFKAEQAIDRVAEAHKRNTEVLTKGAEAEAEALVEMKKMSVIFDGVRDGSITAEAALKTYNETYGETWGIAKGVNEAEDSFIKKSSLYVKATALRAMANEKYAQAQEAFKTGRLAAGQDQTSFLTKFAAGMDALDEVGIMGLDGVSLTKFAKAFTKNYAESQKVLVNDIKNLSASSFDMLMSQGAALEKEANKMLSDAGIKPTGKGKGGKTSTPALKQDKTLLNSLKSEQQLYKDDLFMKRAIGLEILKEEKRLAVEEAKFNKVSKEALLNIDKDFEFKRLLIEKEAIEEIQKIRIAGKDKLAKDTEQTNKEAENEAKKVNDRNLQNALTALKIESDVAMKIANASGKTTATDRIKILENYKSKLYELASTGGYTADQFDKISDALVNVDAAIAGSQDKVKSFNVTWVDTINNINSVIMDFINNSMAALGESIGKALAGENIDVINVFGTLLADALTQIGKQLIALATASLFAWALLKSNNPITAAAALVAGIAAVAAGSFMKSRLEQDRSPKKFANGGIISGPTMGLMGEYPGAKTNPEVVAPLDKLKSMIGSGSGSGEFVLRGNDLILAIQRSNSSLKLRRG